MHVKVNLKIFIFLFLFFITNQIQLYFMIMLFAILHELGHLIAGFIFKFKVEKIELLPIGVSISFSIPVEEYNQKIGKGNALEIKKILIALAGPITNFLIAFVTLVLDFSFLGELAISIVYANLLIALFNLLPIYPLDGGRVLKNLLHIIKGKKEALTLTNLISNIILSILTAIGSIAILYLKNIAIPLILLYLWVVVIRENKRYQLKMNLYEMIEKQEKTMIQCNKIDV